MEGFEPLGRLLLISGIVMAVVGAVLLFAPNIPFLGRLPGDIRIGDGNVQVFIPLGTMLVLSIVLTIILNLVARR